jgi:hypothetical protein
MATVTAIIKKLSEFELPMEFGQSPLNFSLQNYVKLPDQPTPTRISLRPLAVLLAGLVGLSTETLDQNTD